MDVYEVIAAIKTSYIEIQDLLNNKSKSDPESEPFKSKYKARDLLLKLKATIDECLEADFNNVKLKDLLGAVLFSLGNVSYDVEEIVTGQEYTTKAIEIFSHNPVNPSRILCVLSSLNLLGLIWSQRKENEKACDYLLQAEAFYKQFKEQFDIAPVDFDMLFTGESSASPNNVFEKTHTQTLFYLAQVFHHLADLETSGKYCHTTLNRELMSNDFDEVDWALNAATLSQYLLEKHAFKEARHHLAAASKILDMYREKLDLMELENEELREAKKENLRHRSADVARCWAKYGTFLLTLSQERLMESDDDAPKPIPPPPESLRGLEFSNMDVGEHERSITCDYILVYEDAKPLFVKSLDWLNQAKAYYTMEDHASDHVAILQDSSQLYQLLIFYQSDENIQCKMHKRRLDILCKAADELNPTYYMNICRELWFELGEICLAMADLKAAQIGQSEPVSQHLFAKVNHISRKGINYFEQFIKSFKLEESDTGKPPKFPDSHERSLLLAHMYLGRLYSKMLNRDKSVIIEMHKESLRCYKIIVDYCSTFENAKNIMSAEIGVCKEMAELIPIKLQKLMSQL